MPAEPGFYLFERCRAQITRYEGDSGVTLSPEGNIVDYCIETQCRSCFENVQKVVEDSGARWDEVVDVAVYLTDMKKDLQPSTRSMRNTSVKYDPVGRLWKSELFPTLSPSN